MTDLAIEIQENMQQAVTQQTEDLFRSNFNLTRELPENLKALDTISMNFAWSWLPDGPELFRDLDPALWDAYEQNPRRMLQAIPELRLWQRSLDQNYVGRLNKFVNRLDGYLFEGPEHFGQVTPETPAAYFCAEFGVHNSLPIYSGGLGILAGDHLKSSSDLNVPLVAVGLLYRYGYFRQRISHDGWQEERYNDVFESELGLTPVLDGNGEPLTVSVQIRGHLVHAQAWLAKIGRISLYLLDTHLPQNREIDRLITGHLYGGSTETRIVQEKVLGIAGVRLLRKLNVTPSVFHLNEGHSAFLTLELAREYLAVNPDASFEEARQAVREQCVFTTHTPVAAGNDAFSPDELRGCFDANYIAALKLSEQEFFALGRINPADENEYFGMTPFAIRMSRSSNGVSEKHGEVSRELWQKMFHGETEAKDVPITHVTNGVHPPTWVSPLYQQLYIDKIGENWAEIVRDAAAWRTAIEAIPAADLWRIHRSLKHLLVAFIRQRLQRKDIGSFKTINESIDTRQLFDPDILTIGFARRVAAYKRWNLLLTDLERLLRMVDNTERPVQFVFAGKAHPQDRTAKQILQQLMSINHDSNWQNRAVFIEDYDQEVARYLVQGVDVWMNVPRRPLEASGTSGMKSAMNGGLNFSILDGWWIEGYNGSNGFEIGTLETDGNDGENDSRDAESLYSTLENEVIPAFYKIGESGLPDEWIGRMRDAIITLTSQFSTDRMLRDYLDSIYNE